MKGIIKLQSQLQAALAKKPGVNVVPPESLEGLPVSEVYRYVKEMRDFMNEEIEEILLSLSDGDRAINKPWSSRHEEIHSRLYYHNESTMGEAIDMFCFCLNIMLACGIDKDNIVYEYSKVYEKNAKRINDGY